FGSAGVAVAPAGGSDDSALALALQPSDGKAVVVGSVVRGTTRTAGIARLTTSGALDTSFLAAGTQTIPNMTAPRSVVVQSNGRIVVASSAQTGSWVIAGYTGTGVDPTFGSNGVTLVPGTNGEAIAIGLADSIIAVGGNGPSNAFVVHRLGSDGQVDTS